MKVILDTNALLMGTLSHNGTEEYYILPELFSEIQDTASRARLALFLSGCIKKSPNVTTIQFVKKFATLTGDIHTLSQIDILVIALAVDIFTEEEGVDAVRHAPKAPIVQHGKKIYSKLEGEEQKESLLETSQKICNDRAETAEGVFRDTTETLANLSMKERKSAQVDSDSEGWITPTNYKSRSAPKSKNGLNLTNPSNATIKVACMTADFAMQNVLLQLGVPVVSHDQNLGTSNFTRITKLKHWLLRCHACTYLHRPLPEKKPSLMIVGKGPSSVAAPIQFCPSCGSGRTMMRTSYTLDTCGDVTIYLKKNYQYNLRGTQYNIPAMTHGSKGTTSGQKAKQQNLLLREDQKEYLKAIKNYQYSTAKAEKNPDAIENFFGNHRANMAGGALPRIGYGRRNPNEIRK